MFRLKKLKKSQVSIFVIIGIILVIVTVFLFLNGKYEFWQFHDTKAKNQVSEIVEDCVMDSAQRGVFLLGYQGGYIEIPPRVKVDRTAYTDFGMKIPNWDTQRGDIPTIASMQVELSDFVEEDSISCIREGLKGLEDIYEINIKDNLTIDSRINDHNVVVIGNYPIEFKEYNAKESLSVEDYTVKLEDLRLGDLYKLAAQIYNIELNRHIFEELTLDQMRTADDYSSELSVPTEGMSLTCAKRIWTIPQLKKNIANLNNNNFKYLQFRGTYPKEDLYSQTFSGEFIDKESRRYYDNFYTFNLENPKRSFENYYVDVYMPSTEITNEEGYLQSYPYREFEVTPSSGEIVKSMNLEVDVGSKIPVPCIQIFHHLYDLDYDLIVKLTDYNDNSQNFFFQFPIRVEIENNEPKSSGADLILPEPATFNSNSYCIDEQMQYPMLITAKDSYDNSLEDVNISYKCMSVKCDMGSTEKPTYRGVERKYADAQLETDFPFCIGGQVIGEKAGYHFDKKRVDTTDDLLRREVYMGDNLVELELIPKKSFDVSEEMFLIKFKETGAGYRVLSESEGSIYITLENQGLEFESSALWPSSGGYMDKLEFLDRDNTQYNLSIFFMDSNQDLRGMLEIQNWTPDIHMGNDVQFLIPGSVSEITSDDYMNFYEYVKRKVSEDPNYEPTFY
jgi:hypothetical protein